jgi:hypothetical protein
LSISSRTARYRITAFVSVGVGVGLFVILDGAFYQRAAGDFFFLLRANEQARSGAAAIMPLANSPASVGVVDFALHRLGMMFDPAVSGWGWIGCLFWPAVLVTTLFSRGGRFLGAWAGVMYLALALMPISLANGWEFTPIFHGRHLLPACIPFALCLAWVAHRAIGALMNATAANRSCVVVIAAVVLISLLGRHQLNGFRDRDTSRVARAISQIIETTDWSDDRPIFMTASTYWRHRILFPTELRGRLRVAVEDGSPNWWRDACVDMPARHAPLPGPDQAYLIATPKQLLGETEYWDYDVALPRRPLAEWQSASPLLEIARFDDKTIGPSTHDGPPSRGLVVLLGTVPSDIAEATALASTPQP